MRRRGRPAAAPGPSRGCRRHPGPAARTLRWWRGRDAPGRREPRPVRRPTPAPPSCRLRVAGGVSGRAVARHEAGNAGGGSRAKRSAGADGAHRDRPTATRALPSARCSSASSPSSGRIRSAAATAAGGMAVVVVAVAAVAPAAAAMRQKARAPAQTPVRARMHETITEDRRYEEQQPTRTTTTSSSPLP